MAGLTDYTTYDDVRAALGVSSDEIEDATLSLDLYFLNLQAELEQVDPNLPSAFEDLPGVGSQTPLQSAFYSRTKLFATLCVAKQCTTSLPLFAPKDITDGKAAVGRFQNDPYKDVVASVDVLYSRYRSWLDQAYKNLQLNQVADVPLPSVTLMAGAGVSPDPVTGT